MDDLQQKDRDRNIVIAGLNETEVSKDDIRRVLKEKIGTTLSVFDIKHVINLPPSRNKEKATQCSEFTEKDAKSSVKKAKKRLKQTRNLWITDDLTPPTHAKLAYEARKGVRECVIHQP